MEGAHAGPSPASLHIGPGPTRPPVPLDIFKNTQNSKFLLSQAFKWKEIMFFVIPEMPSKTSVMPKKNFLITLKKKKRRKGTGETKFNLKINDYILKLCTL